MKIFYLRDKKRNPVACVAWEYDGKRIIFGISTHNPLDQYKQEVGRALAVGRLIFQPHTLEIAVPNPTILPLLNTIADEPCFPTRTRRAAEFRLKNPPKPKTKKNKAA